MNDKIEPWQIAYIKNRDSILRSQKLYQERIIKERKEELKKLSKKT